MLGLELRGWRSARLTLGAEALGALTGGRPTRVGASGRVRLPLLARVKSRLPVSGLCPWFRGAETLLPPLTLLRFTEPTLLPVTRVLLALTRTLLPVLMRVAPLRMRLFQNG